MNGFRLVPPARLVLVLGSIAGLLTGATAVALAGVALTTSAPAGSTATLEVSHLPPLLALPGEAVTLSYEAFCVGLADTATDAGCRVDGSVLLRPHGEREFSPLPLHAGLAAAGRSLEARVPVAIAGSPEGFEYFAELTDADTGSKVTIPSGGASAPHRSVMLVDPVEVDLGRHVFGRARAADARVAAASWGAAQDEVGLEEGRNLAPVGASAFDVDRGGTVYLLDEAKRRVLEWDARGQPPTPIPVSVSGTLADLAVAGDGSIFVLETVGQAGKAPVVRRFDGFGRELERVEIAERGASQIRSGRGGPHILLQPSHEWMPVMTEDGIADAKTQRKHGRVDRPLADGRSVTVIRVGDEIRITLASPNGARRSWRVRSATPLEEVQLAEPLGKRLVLVMRVYTDDAAEFEVVVLDGQGAAARFSMSADDWAEAAPLGRFKLVGRSLYRLGSTPRGPFVDRYDLEVNR